jgi:hypothetical protein
MNFMSKPRIIHTVFECWYMKSTFFWWNPCSRLWNPFLFNETHVCFYEISVCFLKSMFVLWNLCQFDETHVCTMRSISTTKEGIVNETDVSWPGFISWGPGCHKNFIMLFQRKQRLHCMLGFFFNIYMDRNYLATCGWKLLENLSSCARWDSINSKSRPNYL